MEHKVNCAWKGKMAFETTTDGHKIMIDADEKVGGENRGPIPKPLMLTALAGCTGMDVVSLMKKMRVEFDDFCVEVNGELSEEHPKFYKKIHLDYIITGQDADRDKVRKAVDLSLERYCGVHYMLKRATEVVHKIIFN
ncbi:MAG: OsmC family protein [Flavobacteriales bacterium]